MENGKNLDFLSKSDKSIETLLFFAEVINDFINRSPFIMESLNQEVIRFREVFKRTGTAEAFSSLISLLTEEDFNKLVLAFREAYKEVKENDYRTSITGVVRALTDEDIQRALAFILLFLKKLGKVLGEKYE